MKSKPKKTLQQYEQTIMKSQFESVTKIKNTISKTPMMTTIPHDTRTLKLSSHWINVLRTKEIMTRIMNEYQLNQNIQFFGLYHFTEYTIPQNTESINDLLKYGYHSMLCYFVSFDCLIGVAFTKDLSTGLKDIYDYPFEHLKLFSIILKDHQFEFKSYRTINKQENRVISMNPFVLINQSFKLKLNKTFVSLLSNQLNIKMLKIDDNHIPCVLIQFTSNEELNKSSFYFKLEEFNSFEYVMNEMKSDKYHQLIDNGKFCFLK